MSAAPVAYASFAVSEELRVVLRARLQRLEEAGLRRTQRVIKPDDVEVLCGNDYLGLATDGTLIPAAMRALEAGAQTGSGASRLISGTRPDHDALEAELAAWIGKPAALFFSTGYMANVGLMSALAGPGDLVFSDSLNHASIIDGIRLSRARCVVWPHGNLEQLEAALKSEEVAPGGLRFIATDSIFSMDGDAAPLRALVELAERHDAHLIVDEAHALGVRGPEGRGLVAECGLSDRVAVIIGTCGKAIGTQGAFVCGPPELREWLYNRARSFVYTTAPPPLVAATTRAAIGHLRRGERQAALHERMRYLARGLAELGFWQGEALSTIFPIVVGSAENAVALAEALLDAGIFVHPIRPPTVPEGACRLRVTVSAITPYAALDRLLVALSSSVAELGLTPRPWTHGTIG